MLPPMHWVAHCCSAQYTFNRWRGIAPLKAVAIFLPLLVQSLLSVSAYRSSNIFIRKKKYAFIVSIALSKFVARITPPAHGHHGRSSGGIPSFSIHLAFPRYPNPPDLETPAPYWFALKASRAGSHLWNRAEEYLAMFASQWSVLSLLFPPMFPM